jgi:hypothetical protein
MSIQNMRHEFDKPFIKYKIHLHFPMRTSLNIFFHPLLYIASSKRRQDNNILALTCGWKRKGTHERFMGKNQKTQMHAQTRIDRVGIKDYYKMTLINENMYWMKPTHLLSSFSQNVRVPFCTSTFTSKFLITFSKYTH